MGSTLLLRLPVSPLRALQRRMGRPSRLEAVLDECGFVHGEWRAGNEAIVKADSMRASRLSAVAGFAEVHSRRSISGCTAVYWRCADALLWIGHGQRVGGMMHASPTVAGVVLWGEKKPAQALKAVMAGLVFGPRRLPRAKTNRHAVEAGALHGREGSH